MTWEWAKPQSEIVFGGRTDKTTQWRLELWKKPEHASWRRKHSVCWKLDKFSISQFLICLLWISSLWQEWTLSSFVRLLCTSQFLIKLMHMDIFQEMMPPIVLILNYSLCSICELPPLLSCRLFCTLHPWTRMTQQSRLPLSPETFALNKGVLHVLNYATSWMFLLW